MPRKSGYRTPEQHPEFHSAVRRFFQTCSRADVLDRYNALGIGLGYRRQGRNTLDSLAIRVYVRNKTKKGTAPPNGNMVDPRIPLRCDCGDELEIQTDVAPARIAVPYRLAIPGTGGEFDPRDRVDPLVGGAEIGPIGDRSAELGMGNGTLGGWAWDKPNRRVVLLSNAHVLGSHDANARVSITQPFGGARAREIAIISGSAGYFDDEERVDAAIGAELNLSGVTLTVRDIGPAIMATAEPEARQSVEKYGVGTGHTVGRVVNPYWMGYLETPPIGGAPARQRLFRQCFRIQRRIRKWADHGDSGALVFARTKLPGTDIKPVIGLVFAGEDGNPHIGLACRIHEVFHALGLTSLADGALSLALSAIPLDEAAEIRARDVLRELFERVPGSGETRALHDVLTKHRAHITELIIGDEDGDLRKRVTTVLSLLIGGGKTREQVLRTPLDETLVRAIDDCCKSFTQRSRSSAFHHAVDGVRALIDAKQGHHFGFAIGYSEPGRDEPVTLPQHPTCEDVGAYLDEHGQAELLERFGASGVGTYRHSRTTCGILLKFTGEPPAGVPTSVRWTHAGRTFTIPVQVERGRPEVAL